MPVLQVHARRRGSAALADVLLARGEIAPQMLTRQGDGLGAFGGFLDGERRPVAIAIRVGKEVAGIPGDGDGGDAVPEVDIHEVVGADHGGA